MEGWYGGKRLKGKPVVVHHYIAGLVYKFLRRPEYGNT